VLGALLAAFIIGPKPVTRPPAASLTPLPQVVKQSETSEDAPLSRLMKDKAWTFAHAGPLVLKADFKHGLAAALSMKF
jgi:hypothetical protein